MSGSASFHNSKKSWNAFLAFAVSAASASRALSPDRRANRTVPDKGSASHYPNWSSCDPRFCGKRDVLIHDGWVTYPMMKICSDLEESLKKYPRIMMGTPDPYYA